MKLHFSKYQATGNDFVLIDNRNGVAKLGVDDVRKICDRRFGVGADGLMLIEKHPTLDFNLVYYNSDGTQSLCGNGTRAAMKFASSLGVVNGHASFQAFDGPHSADILSNGIVKVRMNDVTVVKKMGEDYFINTGSPHFIREVTDVKSFAVFDEGRKIRYSDDFKPGGTNANFVQLLGDNTIFVRTYERGVEDETLSCGTGVTATALSVYFKKYRSPVSVKTPGGELSVEFAVRDSGHSVTFHDIFLIGPAKMVFEGDLDL